MPFVNVRGANLFYADDEFIAPWSVRERATVFMQGYIFGSHDEFREMVPTVAREYRVIRMDRRGNGDSEKPPFGYEYNVPDLLADFVGFLDALAIDRVHYIGYHLGGMLGALFAAAHPERVQSLVMFSSPRFISETIQQGFARPGYPDGASAVEALGTWAYARWNMGRNLGPAAKTEDVLRAAFTAEQTGKMPTHVVASLIRMVSAPDFNITPILSSIKSPTLLISETKFQLIPLDEQEIIRKTIPHCDQVLLDSPPWDPDHVAQICLEFIRNH